MHKISKLFKSKVFINGVWLYVLQFFNTIIPLLTLPYITRILGTYQYGVFSFSLNLVSYFQVIVEYGFNLSGAREIALTDKVSDYSKILTRITVCKLFLCCASFIAMIIVCLIVGFEKSQFICMLILYSMVIGTAIQQIWLFQGLQVMKYVTIINAVSRTISVVLIFIFIKNSNQLYLYSSFFAVTSLLIGFFSWLLVSYRMKIKYVKISVKDVLFELKNGWYTFTTSAMSKVFSCIGITVLGFSSSNSTVGVYSAIQKIPYIMGMMYAPIGQAIFPNVSQRYKQSFKSGFIFIKRLSMLIVPLTAFVSLILIVFSHMVVDLLYGNEYSAFSSLLIPLVIWFFFSILNNLLGIQILVAGGYLREYSYAFNFSIVVMILLNIVLGLVWGSYGIAYATLLSEFILTNALVYQINKIKSLHRKGKSDDMKIGEKL